MASIQRDKQKQSGPRPFRYRFHSSKDANLVVVPQLASEENQHEAVDEKVDSSGVNHNVEKSKEQVVTEESTLKETQGDLLKKEDNEKDENLKESKNVNTSSNESKDKTNKDEKNEEESDTKLKINDEIPSKDLNKKTNENSSKNENKDNDKTISSEATKEATPDTQNEKSPIKNSEKETFASNGYTDAGKSKPETCPLGGSWNGYFENPSPRKDRTNSRIQETFYLFFNDTPKSNASITFLDTDTAIPSEEQKLPENHIHVRGMGSNPFGTFHIIGSLNTQTSILQCHRRYLPIQPTVALNPSPSSNKKKTDSVTPTRIITRVRSRSMRLEDMDVRGYGMPGLAFASTSFGPNSERKYHTRKKRMSWQKPEETEGDSTVNTSDGVGQAPPSSLSPRSNLKKQLDKSVSNANAKNNRKRSRAQSESALLSGGSNSSSLSNQANLTIDTSSNPNSNLSKQSDANAKTNLSISSPPPKKSKSPRTSSVTSKKSKSNTSSIPPPHVMTLPKAGEPGDARWRAAHYIFFQMAENPTSDNSQTSSQNQSNSNNGSKQSNSSNNNSSSEPYSFCVYEGEMNKGNQQREGMGICLYPSKNIYQGSFKKNKEHGFGMLLTSDREICIYKGEWERGRMHGKGRYYYQSTGGMYEGEFKENARHGVGRYTLADGGVYDGEWRENVQSGRGNFTWKDGSIYMGLWKDGKRHGQGILKTSDGFTYDGMWNTNAMEGRGIAEYPNGQRYEGLWSKGKKEGRGTIRFTNGAIYEGRFKEDRMEGQGTMKMNGNVCIRGEIRTDSDTDKDGSKKDGESDDEENSDWMIPIQFQSDMGHIHQKAGFTKRGE